MRTRSSQVACLLALTCRDKKMILEDERFWKDLCHSQQLLVTVYPRRRIPISQVTPHSTIIEELSDTVQKDTVVVIDWIKLAARGVIAQANMKRVRHLRSLSYQMSSCIYKGYAVVRAINGVHIDSNNPYWTPFGLLKGAKLLGNLLLKPLDRNFFQTRNVINPSIITRNVLIFDLGHDGYARNEPSLWRPLGPSTTGCPHFPINLDSWRNFIKARFSADQLWA